MALADLVAIVTGVIVIGILLVTIVLWYLPGR